MENQDEIFIKTFLEQIGVQIIAKSLFCFEDQMRKKAVKDNNE